MIKGRRSSFERRCKERGRSVADAWVCVISEDGDFLTVDETHPAYPKSETVSNVKPIAMPIDRKPALARDSDALSWIEKAKNFAVATAKHVAAGLPTCSDEEILRRHDICVGCEFYDNSSCTKCGCPVKRDRQFISKLAWADQSCPVGKWGPVPPAG